MALAMMTCNDFAGHVGTTFTIDLAMIGVAPLTLVEASRRRGVEGRQSPFSLVFRSNSPETWPQSTYRLTHPVLGQLHITLTPLRRVKNGFDYVATFD